MRFSRALIVASIALTACDQSRPDHTSQYYEAHPQEAQARTALCEQLAVTERGAECLNAQAGQVAAAVRGVGTVNPWKR